MFYKISGTKLVERVEKYLRSSFSNFEGCWWRIIVLQKGFSENLFFQHTTHQWFLNLKISYKRSHCRCSTKKGLHEILVKNLKNISFFNQN